MHVAVLRPPSPSPREEGLQRVERGARYGARILGLLAGALPQGDGGDGTVGIRDMCVPTHAVPRGPHTRRNLVFGKRRVYNLGGKEKEGGEGRAGPMAVRGRHKARNPWEYRACASGPARVLHELWGGLLPTPLFSSFLFLVTGFRDLAHSGIS